MRYVPPQEGEAGQSTNDFEGEPAEYGAASDRSLLLVIRGSLHRVRSNLTHT